MECYSTGKMAFALQSWIYTAHDRSVVGKFQLLDMSRRTIHRLSTLFSPGKIPQSPSNQLPLEHLVEVSIFKYVWYSKGSTLKQPTGELNIGVRWGQVLHSHGLQCFCPWTKTKCAWCWVSYWLGFALSHWFLPSHSCQRLWEFA